MADILFLYNVERQNKMLEKAWQMSGLAQEFSVQCLTFSSTDIFSPTIKTAAHSAKLILMCWQGVIYDTELSSCLKKYVQQLNKPCAFFATGSPVTDELQKFSAEDIDKLRQYLLASGMKNFCNFWRYLGQNFLQACVFATPPETLPWNGIYDPASENIFPSLSSYHKFRKKQTGQLTVGILFTRESWIWRDTAYIDTLIKKLTTADIYPLAVFALWADNPEAKAPGISSVAKQYFYDGEKCCLDALINTFKVGLTVSSQNDKDFFRKLNVPVIQGYNLLRPRSEWADSLMGLTPVELSCNVVEPEFDGVIHGVPVSSKEEGLDGIPYYKPLEKRITLLVQKVKKWAILRHKNNAAKKVAIIFHNYPPDNSTIGSAQGLDSPASVALLLQKMAGAGYHLNHIPTDGKELMANLLAGITNDRQFLKEKDLEHACGAVTTASYQEFFATLAETTRGEMTRSWGKEPGQVFFYKDSLIVPGTMNGNILITMQPPRGFGEDKAKIIHDPNCPPPHHYLAFYKWIRDDWGADAVIHVGTHGSLEWLPGKNAALSHHCYPELALGDLPNIYPYYITIIGEGIQAKRRGAACLIGHLNPPMSHADTYDELAELEQLLEEYAHFKVEQPENAPVVAAKITKQVAALHLEEDLPRKEEENLDAYILKIHAYLSKLKHMEIRTGLHILGQPPQDEALTEAVLALTRNENTAAPSLPQTLAAAYGQDYYTLEQHSGEISAAGKRSNAEILDQIWSLSRALVVQLQAKNFAPAAADHILHLPALQSLDLSPKQKNDLQKVAAYICTSIVPNLRKTEQELTNTLRALDGAYIEPGPGGAPTSGRADILPTGRNFYGVSPDNLPTPIAWELGQQLADQVITRFVVEEGHYPESIGIVLWSDSNMRTNGQCIAEFLALLGVKPVWQHGSKRVIGLEVIPLDKLKRPRIDVTARISGLFRDTLHVAVSWLEKAVQLVADLPETDAENYIGKHVQADTQELKDSGLQAAVAKKQALYRLFGCPPGGYGAGVGNLIEGQNWKTIHDIADVYVRWGAHVYGSQDSGDYQPELFRRRLSTIEITIKNMDNHEVHMLDSDDFNAYCGGMNAAVQSIRGQKPHCFIGDSTDRSHAETKSLDEEFRRIYRGESMNPKYLAGMRKHGYKGASDLAATVAHAFAWDCTSQVMQDWMYDGFAQKYALDPEMQRWMQEVNPWALRRIAAKLLEAEKRGMWQPDLAVKEKLQKLYLNIEGELENRTDTEE